MTKYCQLPILLSLTFCTNFHLSGLVKLVDGRIVRRTTCKSARALLVSSLTIGQCNICYARTSFRSVAVLSEVESASTSYFAGPTAAAEIPTASISVNTPERSSLGADLITAFRFPLIVALITPVSITSASACEMSSSHADL